jgi:hypothetical protein
VDKYGYKVAISLIGTASLKLLQTKADGSSATEKLHALVFNMQNAAQADDKRCMNGVSG